MNGLWTDFTNYLRGISTTTRFLLVAAFAIVCLLCLLKFMNKNVQKDKMKIGSLVIGVVFLVGMVFLVKYC